MTRALQWTAAFTAVVAVALSGAALYMGSRIDAEDFTEGSIWGSAALALALIGTAIVLRRPRHRIGWLLVMAGMGEITAGVSNLYGQYSTATGHTPPYSDLVGWFGGALWPFSAAALLVFLPLYFPTGQPPSPRWRWIGWIGWLGIAALVAGTVDVALFLPHLMGEEWEVVEVAASGRPLFVASEYGFPVLMAAGPLALVSLVVRYIRSRGEERQQVKLLVFAVTLTVTFVLATNLTEMPGPLEAAASAVALPSIGVATMVAVLRYRLFDIDRIISRTLGYAILSVLLVAIYLGAVTALTAVTTPLTGSSPVAVAVATLLAAAVFQPARRRIQSAVDRRFNRARYDARQTVEVFASSLRQEVDIDDVRGHLVGTVNDILNPTTVRVWLRPGGNP